MPPLTQVWADIEGTPVRKVRLPRTGYALYFTIEDDLVTVHAEMRKEGTPRLRRRRRSRRPCRNAERSPSSQGRPSVSLLPLDKIDPLTALPRVREKVDPRRTRWR